MQQNNVAITVQQRIGVAYIRESTEEQDKGYSPDNQFNTISRYAKEHQIKITETYKDLITGTSASKRDDFQRMITDAMQKKFDVILVFHTSRFARNVEEARQYKNLLRKKHGIKVVFVTQQFGNEDDPSAFLNEGVNELFDEYYSRNLSFWVRSNLMEKRSQGYQNGSVPFGYYKKRIGYDKEKDRPIYERLWRVEPQEAKLVKKMFAWYSTGLYSLPDIAEKLNRLGVKTKNKNPFVYSTIKDILHNRVYLGYVCSPKRKSYPELPGKHPAIISEKLYKKVQQAFAERHNTNGRPVAQHRFYLLQGLVFCYHCRHYIKGRDEKKNTTLIPRMYCQKFGWQQREYLTYSCKLRKESRLCSQKNVSCKVIDNQLLQVMQTFELPQDIQVLVIQKLREMLTHAANKPKDTDMLEKLEKQKKKLATVFTKTDSLSEEEYLAKVQNIEAQIAQYDTVELGTSVPLTKISDYLKQTEKFLSDFQNFWNDLDKHDQRAWIQMTTRRVWVKDDAIVGLEPTEKFKPLFVAHVLVNGRPPSGTPSKIPSICWVFLIDPTQSLN